MDITANTRGALHAGERLLAVERSLLEQRAVSDAVALVRRDEQGAERIVAYVVPADDAAIPTLRAHLAQCAPSAMLPLEYVFLSAMPLNEQGEVALDVLEGFAIFDADVVERWKRVFDDADAVHRAEIVLAERVHELGSVHRSELLRGVRVPRAAAAASSAPPKPADAGDSAQVVSPAFADGGPLVESAGAPKTLPEALLCAAATAGGANGIVHVGRDGSCAKQSYEELRTDAERVLAGLASLGLGPGDKVVFQLADSRDFLTAFWACELGGLIPALLPIPPRYSAANAVVERLLNAWQLLDRPLILASDSLVGELRHALGLSGSDALRVRSVAEMPREGAVPEHTARADDLALILFTSGSTGIPKGVMQSHRSLLSMAAGTAQQNGFSSRDATLNWMPLDHVGAISFLHVMPTSLGCRQVHVPTDYIVEDPLRWLDLMDREGVTISWGPNFAFKLINERSREIEQGRWDLTAVRFLVSAGEMIVRDTVRRSLELLGRHGLSAKAVRPAFGMSETCSGVTWSEGYSDSKESAFVDLGPPIPSASLRIVDDEDRLLNEGDIGRLQVKGASVTSGYYGNPEATARAFTADGWFDTGDLGSLRNGRLTLTGREKDEIIINGINFVAAEIEAVVDSVPGVEVAHSAACAVRSSAGGSDELAVFFAPVSFADGPLAAALRDIKTQVADRIGVSTAHLVPLRREQIPKTSIGKIQRSELRRRFEEGEFDAAARRADLLTGTNVIPRWFFRKVWQPKAAQPRRELQECANVLVLADSRGLAAALRERFEREGVPCVVAEPAAGFAAVAGRTYRFDPASSSDYERLVRAACESAGPIATVIHCITYDDADRRIDSVDELAAAQRRGLYALLHLVQAVARVQADAREVAVYMVGAGTQVTSTTDGAGCAHAAAVGLVKTIPCELGWMTCRHVDLEADDARRDAQRVIDELRTSGDDDEVAYRNGRRLVWGLAPADMAGGGGVVAEAVKPRGIYLITGGLGGIGSHLAQALIRDYGVRPILVGTSVLPPRAEWPEHLRRGDKLADRLRQYLAIEALGGELVYAAVDVADLASLRGVVAAAEARWGETLSGVFHLAAGGDVGAHWSNLERFSVCNETEESFDAVLRAKVYGTWAVYALAQERPGCVVVPFGSVIGLFGAAHFGSYAAAHTFMQNFALTQRHRHGIRSSSLSWAVWEDIGLSSADPVFAKDFYRATGYCLIDKDQGYDCLLAALSRDEPQLTIGLDGGKPGVRRRMTSPVQPLEEIVAFAIPSGSSAAEAWRPTTSIADAFGAESRCEVVWVDRLPVGPDGTVDRAVLLADARRAAGADAPNAAPRSDMERRLAAMWREILPGQRIGVHDSFFALGGNSLSATRLLSRIRQELGIDLDIRVLFTEATVHRLAALLDEKLAASAGEPAAESCETIDAATLLERVEDMSDAEVADLLNRMRSGSGRP